MIATLRKKAQITIPGEIVEKLGLTEGVQLEVWEKDGVIGMLPLAAYPAKYVSDLKKEVGAIKEQLAAGEKVEFKKVDMILETMGDIDYAIAESKKQIADGMELLDAAVVLKQAREKLK